ncbi:hypothetical protein [Cupriavidus oxalaticus]|jgi:hypothetical protein|uniref:Enoyl-CoA hydratase n=1 Tax=Cupriavidus oxalaticus TaxID=96344 RepID=A0A375GM27_9BURK|nr:hypothetical protein JTE91_05465 [Cupriavidus oxalaticus]QRQ92682.1 hypothetical protein JTE92_06880 [Cupriavidus oxalaticus]SPC09894.1 hypothetical protein CO2235_U860020 [Cupriavidus oxalaticus]SPC24329.1 hypothetical protein CO2235_MP80209 [Cupriavidus oxalaticus]
MQHGAQLASPCRLFSHQRLRTALTQGPTFDASLALEVFGFGGPEAREDVASFREKRAPVFPTSTSS